MKWTQGQGSPSQAHANGVQRLEKRSMELALKLGLEAQVVVGRCRHEEKGAYANSQRQKVARGLLG